MFLRLLAEVGQDLILPYAEELTNQLRKNEAIIFLRLFL